MPIAIRGSATATAAHVIALATQVGSERMREVERYAATLWKIGGKLGIDPAGAAAQAAHETGGWRSALWRTSLNPAGMKTRDGTRYQSFANGEVAALAQLSHLSVYSGGWKGAQKSIRYLMHNERWFVPLTSGVVPPFAKTYHDLAGRWAEDTVYGDKIDGWYGRLLRSITTPSPTPGTNPPPGIIFHPTGNRWSPRIVERPIFVVRHITDDLSLQRVISWFQNPSSQASSHFLIDRDGTIHQFVSTLDAAWTNGKVDRPRTDIPPLNAAIASGINLNHYCVTIEHIADRNSGVTEAQFKATVLLGRYINDRYGIAPHRYAQLRHSDIDSVDRPYCPGPHFPLERIIRELGGDPTRMAP